MDRKTILCSSDSAELEEEGLSDLTGFWASHDFWLNYFITLQVVESWVSGTILFQRQSKAFCEAELQAVPALEEDAPGIALCARALHVTHAFQRPGCSAGVSAFALPLETFFLTLGPSSTTESGDIFGTCLFYNWKRVAVLRFSNCSGPS